MDRRKEQGSLDCCPVRIDRAIPTKLLLREDSSDNVRSHAHETRRRNLYSETILRISSDYRRSEEGRLQRKPQEDSRGYERSRVGREPARPQHVEEPSRTPQVSLSSKGSSHHEALAGVEYGYHIHPITGWVCVPRGCDRLVQSVSSIEPTLEQYGEQFLRGGLRGGRGDIRLSRDLQHRPGSAIFLSGFCKCHSRKGNTVQHGRKGEGLGQHLYRTSMEIREVRGGLPA